MLHQRFSKNNSPPSFKQRRPVSFRNVTSHLLIRLSRRKLTSAVHSSTSRAWKISETFLTPFRFEPSHHSYFFDRNHDFNRLSVPAGLLSRSKYTLWPMGKAPTFPADFFLPQFRPDLFEKYVRIMTKNRHPFPLLNIKMTEDFVQVLKEANNSDTYENKQMVGHFLKTVVYFAASLNMLHLVDEWITYASQQGYNVFGNPSIHDNDKIDFIEMIMWSHMNYPSSKNYMGASKWYRLLRKFDLSTTDLMEYLMIQIMIQEQNVDGMLIHFSRYLTKVSREKRFLRNLKRHEYYSQDSRIVAKIRAEKSGSYSVFVRIPPAEVFQSLFSLFTNLTAGNFALFNLYVEKAQNLVEKNGNWCREEFDAVTATHFINHLRLCRPRATLSNETSYYFTKQFLIYFGMPLQYSPGPSPFDEEQQNWEPSDPVTTLVQQTLDDNFSQRRTWLTSTVIDAHTDVIAAAIEFALYNDDVNFLNHVIAVIHKSIDAFDRVKNGRYFVEFVDSCRLGILKGMKEYLPLPEIQRFMFNPGLLSHDRTPLSSVLELNHFNSSKEDFPTKKAAEEYQGMISLEEREDSLLAEGEEIALADETLSQSQQNIEWFAQYPEKTSKFLHLQPIYFRRNIISKSSYLSNWIGDKVKHSLTRQVSAFAQQFHEHSQLDGNNQIEAWHSFLENPANFRWKTHSILHNVTTPSLLYYLSLLGMFVGDSRFRLKELANFVDFLQDSVSEAIGIPCIKASNLQYTMLRAMAWQGMPGHFWEGFKQMSNGLFINYQIEGQHKLKSFDEWKDAVVNDKLDLYPPREYRVLFDFEIHSYIVSCIQQRDFGATLEKWHAKLKIAYNILRTDSFSVLESLDLMYGQYFQQHLRTHEYVMLSNEQVLPYERYFSRDHRYVISLLPILWDPLQSLALPTLSDIEKSIGGENSLSNQRHDFSETRSRQRVNQIFSDLYRTELKVTWQETEDNEARLHEIYTKLSKALRSADSFLQISELVDSPEHEHLLTQLQAHRHRLWFDVLRWVVCLWKASPDSTYLPQLMKMLCHLNAIPFVYHLLLNPTAIQNGQTPPPTTYIPPRSRSRPFTQINSADSESPLTAGEFTRKHCPMFCFQALSPSKLLGMPLPSANTYTQRYHPDLNLSAVQQGDVILSSFLSALLDRFEIHRRIKQNTVIRPHHLAEQYLFTPPDKLEMPAHQHNLVAHVLKCLSQVQYVQKSLGFLSVKMHPRYWKFCHQYEITQQLTSQSDDDSLEMWIGYGSIRSLIQLLKYVRFESDLEKSNDELEDTHSQSAQAEADETLFFDGEEDDLGETLELKTLAFDLNDSKQFVSTATQLWVPTMLGPPPSNLQLQIKNNTEQLPGMKGLLVKRVTLLQEETKLLQAVDHLQYDVDRMYADESTPDGSIKSHPVFLELLELKGKADNIRGRLNQLDIRLKEKTQFSIELDHTSNLFHWVPTEWLIFCCLNLEPTKRDLVQKKREVATLEQLLFDGLTWIPLRTDTNEVFCPAVLKSEGSDSTLTSESALSWETIDLPYLKSWIFSTK